MKNVIIVSKCVRVSSCSSEECLYTFHFKGVFAGDLLRSVVLRGRKDFNIRRGEEYLLYVILEKIEKEVLSGKILKIRPLEECWDRS